MIVISAQAFPPSSGGIQTLMAGLARAASESHAVHVFADGNRDAAAFDIASNPPFGVTRFSGVKPMRRRVKAKAVSNMCAANTVSHVFCDSWKSAEHLSSDLTCPVIVYAHGNEFPQSDAPLSAKLSKKRARIAKAFSRADHIISVSKQTAERAALCLPKQALAPIHVRPNPVDAPAPAAVVDKALIDAAWAEIDPDNDAARLLCLSRLIDWKGIDTAIMAVRDLRTRGYKPALIIAGDGPDEARLKDIVKRENLGSFIHFIGRIGGGAKTALFESAHIFMQAGRKVGDQCEGFGITYIEAGLLGLPSISGNQGGAPDAVINGETGIVVDGTDQSAVSAAVIRLIDEDAVAHHMSKKAHSHANDLLWHKQIGQILNLAKGT